MTKRCMKNKIIIQNELLREFQHDAGDCFPFQSTKGHKSNKMYIAIVSIEVYSINGKWSE